MFSVRKNRYLVLLHLVVIIFGFTAILGKLITIDSTVLVWYRMLIATLFLFVFLKFKKNRQKLKSQSKYYAFATGLVIAAHWVLFFESIKQSNVSVALMALSTSATFTAFLQPLFSKSKIKGYEIALGLIVLSGISLIFFNNKINSLGIVLGIFSAILAAIFTIINAKLIKKGNATSISLIELFGGFCFLSVYLNFNNSIEINSFLLSMSDLIYLLILGIVCTAFAFVASVEVMRELSPFTVSLSINLEPIYGIILAYFIFGEEEKMTLPFYIGASLILLSIFLNVLLTKRKKFR